MSVDFRMYKNNKNKLDKELKKYKLFPLLKKIAEDGKDWFNENIEQYWLRMNIAYEAIIISDKKDIGKRLISDDELTILKILANGWGEYRDFERIKYDKANINSIYDLVILFSEQNGEYQKLQNKVGLLDNIKRDLFIFSEVVPLIDSCLNINDILNSYVGVNAQYLVSLLFILSGDFFPSVEYDLNQIKKMVIWNENCDFNDFCRVWYSVKITDTHFLLNPKGTIFLLQETPASVKPAWHRLRGYGLDSSSCFLRLSCSSRTMTCSAITMAFLCDRLFHFLQLNIILFFILCG